MSEPGNGEEGNAPATNGRAGRGRRRAFRILGVIALVCAVAGGTWWYLNRNLESTDDAFLEGATVTISPRVGGTVAAVHMTDNGHVSAGDTLLEIDAAGLRAVRDEAAARLAEAEAKARVAVANLELTRASTDADLDEAQSGVSGAEAALAQARSQVQQAEAEAKRAQADAKRFKRLLASHSVSEQRYDQALATTQSADAALAAARDGVRVAQARAAEAQARLAAAQTAAQQIAAREAELQSARTAVTAARAVLDKAKIDLGYTRITAPQDGYVTKKAVEKGDVVQPDQMLARLVSGRPWVVANFKETQLTRMRAGQPVKVHVDAYPDLELKGHVDSIQRGTGARFALLPPENATGNFVKVVQRVPVKIVLDELPDADHVLALGMSVVPTVDVSAAPEKP